MMKVERSVCPYDCPDACGLEILMEEGRIVRVRGHQDHAFTRGTICQKMARYDKTIYHPHRIQKPLRRVGQKGKGEFVEITWDEALEEMSQRWTECIDTYGSESIMPYSYAGTMGVIQKSAGDPLFAILGATRQDRGICSPAKKYGWNSLMGTTLGTRPQEAADSDCIILWGLNAVATNLHILRDVTTARQAGAVIWAIDTHHTETMELADESVTIRPGTDGALALGIAYILGQEEFIDKAFMQTYVQGAEEFQSTVLTRYTPEYVESITGVPLERIYALARSYGRAKAPFIRMGSGLSRYGNGANTVRCIATLPALVGAYAHRGGGLLASTSGSHFVGSSYLQWEKFQKKPSRLNPMIYLGRILTTPQEIPIKALYVYSSNPAITAPNQRLVRQGLRREDLFVVVHERFMTDTAKYADIVLPATTSVEHNDVYNSYGHYTIGCGYQLIEPIGESRSNWNTICSIAKAMQIDHPIFDASEIDLIHHILEESELESSVKEAILQGEFVEMTLPDNYKLQFGTPSGKIEIYNPLESDPLPVYRPAYGDAGEFFLINGTDPRILDSSFCEHDFQGQITMIAWMHPEDARAKGVAEDDYIRLVNVRGSLRITLGLDEQVPKGCIVSPGVWWQAQSDDPEGTVNVLTADRPTDYGMGSTFYDVKVDVYPCQD